MDIIIEERWKDEDGWVDIDAHDLLHCQTVTIETKGHLEDISSQRSRVRL